MVACGTPGDLRLSQVGPRKTQGCGGWKRLSRRASFPEREMRGEACRAFAAGKAALLALFWSSLSSFYDCKGLRDEAAFVPFYVHRQIKVAVLRFMCMCVYVV